MWEPPYAFDNGEPTVILGGGPSLNKEDIARAEHCNVIAINDAYKLAPWADLLYFCDPRWYGWHRENVMHFAGMSGQVATMKDDMGEWTRIREDIPSIWLFENTGEMGFDPQRGNIRHGKNSGYQAIHIAKHLGARKIILLGFDMHAADGRTHWHKGHPEADPPTVYDEYMLPRFPSLMAALALLGVEIINCTPGSALKVWPIMSLEKAL